MELRQLLEILWRRRRLCLGVFLAVFLGVMGATLTALPRYSASARVLLYKSPSATTLLTTLGLRTAGSPESVSDAEVANYKQIALSRPVMEKVIAELQLTRLRGRAILPRMIPGVPPLFRALGLENFLNATLPMQWDELMDKSALQFFFPRPLVEVKEDEDADVFEIATQSTDMGEAVAMANAAAAAFMQREAEMQREEYFRFGESVTARLPVAKAELDRAMGEMKTFREREKTLNVDEEVTRFITQAATIATQEDEAKVQAERSRAMLAEVMRKLAATPRYVKSQEQIERNPAIDAIKLTLRDLYLDLANTKTRYTEQHPAVQDIQNRIAQARESIQEEAGKVFGSETRAQDPLYTELAQQAAVHAADAMGYDMQRQAYAQVGKELEKRLGKYPSRQREYALLQIQQRRAEDYYQHLLDLSYQIETARTLAVSNLRLVEAAVWPPDIKDYKRPKLTLHFALAVLLGGFLALGGTFLWEHLDSTVLREDDLAAAGAPCLASLPPLDGHAGGAAPPPAHAPLDFLAATLQGDLVRREAASPGSPGMIVGLLPVSPEEEAVPLALHLTRALDAAVGPAGRIVCLVEAHCRAPELAGRLGLSTTPGLREVLEESAALPDATRALSDGRQATALPAGAPLAEPEALLSAASPLWNEFRRRHALTLVLLPPFARHADAVRLADQLDGVLLLARRGVTPRQDVARAVTALREAGLAVRGGVLFIGKRRRGKHRPTA